MLKWKFAVCVLLIFTLPVLAQQRIKPKPEKETKKKEIMVKKKKKAVVRSKVQKPPLLNTGGVSISSFNNKYMGFGAQYGRIFKRRTLWSVHFQYFTVPSDRFYFDPYYYQFVQRNRGSIMMLTITSKILLPWLEDEPNISPYWVVGAGPVLGIQSDLRRTFPGSMTHAYSLGGFTAFTGPGTSYFINSWFLNFNISYHVLRFPQNIFGKDNFDGFMFSLGVGKMF